MLAVNLFLFTGSCAALRVLLLLRKEKKLAQMFADIDKMPLFNLSYLQSIADLPVNKPFLLSGKVTSDRLQSTFSDRSVQAILSTVVPSQKEKQKDVGNGIMVSLGNLISFKRNHPIQFSLQSDEHKLTVSYFANRTIKLFNLPKLRDNIMKSEISHLQIKNSMFQNNTFTEYALLPNKEYVVCGQLQNDQTIIPILIAGSSKESLIESLDDELINLRKSSNLWVSISVGISVLAAIYAKYYKKSMKRNQENN